MIYDVSIYDIDGFPIAHMVQWDFGRYIYIKETDLTEAHPVHFFNIESDVAYVVETTYEGGRIKAKIPNILLTQPHTINGYVYVTEDGESKSLYQFRIPIRKRPQPSDVIYEGSEDYIAVATALSECKKYAEQASENIDAAETAAANAKESADRAAAFAEEAERNVADALTQAKESGEFDGEPGASGVFVSETASETPPDSANVHIVTGETGAVIKIPDSWEREGNDVYLLCDGERIGNSITLKDGKNFTILGYYDTLDLMKEAVTSPEPGDAYGIGTESPYNVWVFDAITQDWIDNGPLSGVAGADGTDGVGVKSINQTTTSTEDGGTNVIMVTLSNNEKSTFTVKNGTKGSDGYSPQKGTDYWTETDQKAIVDEVLTHFIDATEVAM